MAIGPIGIPEVIAVTGFFVIGYFVFKLLRPKQG
jgi:hypothetical protein